MKFDSDRPGNDFYCERFSQFLNDCGSNPVTP